MYISLEDQELVSETFLLLTQNLDRAGIVFYEHFFALAPDAKSLFEDVPMVEQRRKLMQMISTIVHSLLFLPEIRHELRDLGKRHAEYGAIAAQMRPMREALIMMLRDRLGDQFTPKAEVAWRNVYDVIEKYVVEGLEG